CARGRGRGDGRAFAQLPPQRGAGAVGGGGAGRRGPRRPVNGAAPAVRRAPLLALLIGTAAAQGASVHAAFAADPRADGPPGLVWLRQELLARRSEWPAGLQPLDAFALHVDARGLRIGEALPVPRGAIAAGELALDGEASATFATGVDGHDELRLRAAAVPPALAPLLAALHVDVDGAPP